MTRLAFTVPGPPVTWKRAKRGHGHSYTDPAAAAQMDRIRAAARNAGCRAPETGAVYLRLRVWTPYPPTSLPSGDLDNHEKILKDALNGLAWLDDRQVVHVEKRKEQDRDSPRIEVEIAAEVVTAVAEATTRARASLLVAVSPARREKVVARRLVTSVRRFGA